MLLSATIINTKLPPPMGPDKKKPALTVLEKKTKNRRIHYHNYFGMEIYNQAQQIASAHIVTGKANLVVCT